MTDAMDHGLELSNACLSVNGRSLITDLSLRIAPGNILTLMGKSGAGKSSLVAFICGALDPAFQSCGAVRLDGADVTRLPIEKRRIGVLFQDDLLFAHMTVAENLAFAVPQGIARNERSRRVIAALEEAELAEFAGRDPATLSGGQRSRAALMRAILAEPRALLLDEPFSRLDSELRARIRTFTFSVISRRNIPALLVTHDQADASGDIMRL
jgi:putative thiamine transport system ATP-binding protein